MKKRGTGLLAALVCALLLAALSPAPASAAGGQTPAAAAAAADRTAARVKASGSQTVRIGKWYSMSVPQNYTVGGKPVSVKFQWQVKKGSGKPYVNVKGAAGNTYCYKATKGKDGWRYRCRVSARYVSAEPFYYYFRTLKVRK